MSQNKETSRKLLEKQQRRQAEEARLSASRKAARRRNLVTLGVVLVVLIVVVGLVVKDRSGTTSLSGVSAAEAACTEIERPALQEAAHIEQGAPHEPYSSDPPSSGPHYATPADAGFYPSALPVETVIHNMEHGQVVIWYQADLPAPDLDLIEKITREEPLATAAVPHGLDPSYQVALTAWGALQFCEGISEEAIALFRAEFQGRGPEQVGVPVFDLPEGIETPEGFGGSEPAEETSTPEPTTEPTPEPEETKKKKK